MTPSPHQLKQTDCVIGIDVDDTIFKGNEERIRRLFPCPLAFVAVEPEMYGRVRKIWNHLARQAMKDFIVLLGDETLLKDCNWHEKVVAEFHQVAESSRIPFGAACLALNDESFPMFSDFPCHSSRAAYHFHSLLPKQFVNQG